jgi:hypothetical protein
MPLIDEGVYHGILEVGPSPPSYYPTWPTLVAFVLKEWRYGFGEPALHVDHGTVEVEGQDFETAQPRSRRHDLPFTLRRFSSSLPTTLAFA